MDNKIDQLEPRELWTNFAALNAVPRASKKEEQVMAFMMDFAAQNGLDAQQDETGNIIVRKPATTGMENAKTIVLQSHLDMVHQKNNDTDFDFGTQGIKMLIEGDWVKAQGTTLGADNGIGVAAIMGILASSEIKHPAIEALFTIDEETGMTGAMGLKGGVLKGDILLNLDTEQDNEIDIGCAGGVDVTATKTYTEEPVADGAVAYTLTVKGLQGGHSGMDIHKGLGNANKIMNRILNSGQQNAGLRLAALQGGSLRNAVPRESVAQVVLSGTDEASILERMQRTADEIKFEYRTMEPGLEIRFEKAETTPAQVMPAAEQKAFVQAIYAAHNGVYRMSAELEDLVETSNNIARVSVEKGKISIKCLTRSSVESSKFDLANALRAAFELMGCDVELSGSYPGWTPNPNSEILKLLKAVYQKQNNAQAEVVACHAGLECGILGKNYPQMDMISFGPTILGAHSPAERVSISSVQKFWKFLLEVLGNIPAKV
ncbi:MAG: aminoacyl-histidine dipeptidase [Arcticibacter sp.]